MSDSKPSGADAPTLAQSAVVELVLGAIGLVFIVVVGRNIGDAYSAPVDRLPAAGFGLATGLVLGGAFGVGVTRPFFAERVRPFLARFTSARPTILNFAIIGLAAALGEETLFRAAVQPSMGIWIAALLFTIAHAAIADYRHPTLGKLAYAALAFGMGVLFGIEYDHLGIAASMATHFAFDTTALLLIRPLLPAREVAN
jgi:CAAX amino terminal protease family.